MKSFVQKVGVYLLMGLIICCTVALAEEWDVGSRVFFGTYEQDRDISNGPETIEWIVLDRMDTKALLLSAKCLDVSPFYEGLQRAEWETSDLREKLNGTFADEAFSSEERRSILVTDNGDVTDAVFALSKSEVEAYSAIPGVLDTAPTKYAAFMGAGNMRWLNTPQNMWWTRSSGYGMVTIVDAKGSFRSMEANQDSISVRPALWLSLNPANFVPELCGNWNWQESTDDGFVELHLREDGSMVLSEMQPDDSTPMEMTGRWQAEEGTLQLIVQGQMVEMPYVIEGDTLTLNNSVNELSLNFTRINENNAFRNAVVTINGLSFRPINEDEAVLLSYEGDAEQLVVPDQIVLDGNEYSVVRIAESALGNQWNLKQIVLPSTLREIGPRAFIYCTSLQQLMLPGSLESIGEYAFANCTALETVALPPSLREISAGTFSNCEGLKTMVFGANLLSVCESAFEDCTSLENVMFSAGLESIGSYAFKNCYYLKNVAMVEGVVSIGEGAFQSCHRLSVIQLPQSLTELGSRAFANTTLQNVVLPNGITKVSEGLFLNCEELRTVVLPQHLKVIEANAFKDCKALSLCVLPTGLEFLGESCFFGTALTSVILPEGLTNISSDAFHACRQLQHIDLPDSLQEIGPWAFAQTVLTELHTGPNLISIGDGAFASTNLFVLEMAEGIESIGNEAFAYTNLTSAYLPASLTWIGDKALNLRVAQVLYGSYADSYAKSKNIHVEYVKLDDYSFEYVFLEDGSACITGMIGSDVEIVVPPSIDGYPVTAVGDEVFAQNPMVMYIVLPEGLRSIGSRAFYRCDQLVGVELPEGLTELGSGVFSSCKALTEVQLPQSLTVIPEDTFYGCSSLVEFTLPAGIERIGARAFMGCGIAQIELPVGLTSIGSASFENCGSLAAIRIPEGIQYLNANVFKNCRSLEKIELPESLIYIGDYAFMHCTALKEIVLPSSLTGLGTGVFHSGRFLSIELPADVTDIPTYCFNDCTRLESVVMHSQVKSIGDYAFSGCKALVSIEIPDSCTSIGRNAFLNCEKITEINLPDVMTYISPYGFNSCEGLRIVRFGNAEVNIGENAFYQCPNVVLEAGSNASVVKYAEKYGVAYNADIEAEKKEELPLDEVIGCWATSLSNGYYLQFTSDGRFYEGYGDNSLGIEVINTYGSNGTARMYEDEIVVTMNGAGEVLTITFDRGNDGSIKSLDGPRGIYKRSEKKLIEDVLLLPATTPAPTPLPMPEVQILNSIPAELVGHYSMHTWEMEEGDTYDLYLYPDGRACYTCVLNGKKGRKIGVYTVNEYGTIEIDYYYSEGHTMWWCSADSFHSAIIDGKGRLGGTETSCTCEGKWVDIYFPEMDFPTPPPTPEPTPMLAGMVMELPSAPSKDLMAADDPSRVVLGRWTAYYYDSYYEYIFHADGMVYSPNQDGYSTGSFVVEGNELRIHWNTTGRETVLTLTSDSNRILLFEEMYNNTYLQRQAE